MRDTLLDPSLDPADWRRISQYLDQALDLEPAARESWLAELAATEPNIVPMLRALLAKHETLNADGFMERSPAVVLSDLASPHAGTAGERIGAYTLERLIGRGGMGEVWLATRSDGRFEGRCAIKFLDSHAPQARSADRFRHEGRLLARLAHPNIARLIDAGTTDDGRPYLALEYVDGESIERYCGTHALEIEKRVQLFVDVVSAVAHAHANLIIHRDLKPTNVLVTQTGVVKLLDFGIAKLLSTEDDAHLTKFEEVALTPEYAAPEQLLGEVPSTATDVYQLGMLLYVLLTGRHPLQFSGSRAERVRAALEGRVPLASEFTEGALAKALRGDLDSILSMALRKDPGERYATAAALREDLLRYLNREPVSARRGAALYQIRKFVGRHRVAVLASGVAVASLCAALVFAFSQARVAAGERDRALGLVTRNEAVTEFMGAVITEAAASEKPVTVKDMLARSEEMAEADTQGNRENRAAVLLMMADYYSGSGDLQKSVHLLERALGVLSDSPDRNIRSQIVCAHAMLVAQTTKSPDAMRTITHELENPPPDPVSAAQCLHYRSLMAVVFDDADGASRYAAEALARLRASGRGSKNTEAGFLEGVATAYQLKGQNREAFDYYGQALQKFAEAGRGHSPPTMVIRNNWAVASDTAGEPKRALALYEETLRIGMESDPEHPHPVVTLNRARSLEALGRYREAMAGFQSALQLNRDAKVRVGELYALLGLADTSIEMGDLAAAGNYVTQAMQVLGPSEPANTLPAMRASLTQGRLALSTGHFSDALAHFTRALTSKRSKSSTTDVERGKAEAELLAGDVKASVQDARLALSIATELQGGVPYSRRTGLAWLILGRGLQTLGDTGEARKAFGEAVTHLSNTVDADHPALVEARTLL